MKLSLYVYTVYVGRQDCVLIIRHKRLPCLSVTVCGSVRPSDLAKTKQIAKNFL